MSIPDIAEKTYEQGKALYDLRRYPEAEKMLRQALAKDPRHAFSHAYLALSLLAQSTPAAPKPAKLRDALDEARRAVAASPEHEFPYFVLAWSDLANRKEAEALKAAQDGLRINSQSTWGYIIFGHVYLSRREWDKALQMCDTGLAIDPEDSGLLNQRARALIMLDRKPEARAAVKQALVNDPNSDDAHTNSGWLALYEGDQQAALVNFREALRLDPLSETARQGFIQSLQSRNPIYRWMMRYSLWVRRLTRSESLAFLIMLSSLDRGLRAFASYFPPFWIIYLPFAFLYSIFVFFSWTSDAFFYLMLRLNKNGKILLSKDEVAAANSFGICLLIILVNIIGGLIFWKWGFLAGAVMAGMLLVPVAGIFQLSPSKRGRRIVLTVMVAWMVIAAACGQTGVFLETPWLIAPLILFVIGWFIYPWIANLMMLID